MAHLNSFIRKIALAFLLLGCGLVNAQFHQVGEPQTDSFPDVTVKLETRDPLPRPAAYFKVQSGDADLPHRVESAVGPDSGKAKSVLVLWELLSYAERKKQNAYFRELLENVLPDLLQEGDEIRIATFAWTDLEDGTRTLNFLDTGFSEDVGELLAKIESAKPPGGKNVQPNHGSELFPAMTEGIATLAPLADRAKVMVVLSAEFPNLYNPKSDNALVIAKAREADVAIYNYRYKVKADKYNLNEIATATYGESWKVDSADVSGTAMKMRGHLDAASQAAAGMVHEITFTTDHPSDGDLHQVQISGGTESITVSYNAPSPGLVVRLKENLLVVIIIAVVLLLAIILMVVLGRRRKSARVAEMKARQREIADLADKGEVAEARLADLSKERQAEEEKRRQAEVKKKEKEAQNELELLRKEMFAGGKAPRLTIFLNEGSETVELPGPVVVVGRASESDIAIEHNTISRHHAQIIYESGIYQLRDLGSTNGTFHNGSQVEEAVLKHGDTISFGSVRIMFYL
jgi:hypothetical protein